MIYKFNENFPKMPFEKFLRGLNACMTSTEASIVVDAYMTKAIEPS